MFGLCTSNRKIFFKTCVFVTKYHVILNQCFVSFLGEITEYELAYYGDDVSCRLNERNTCKRALCECDLEFARGLPDQIDSYSDDFHTYWSPDEYKWNPKEDCVKRKFKSNYEKNLKK